MDRPGWNKLHAAIGRGEIDAVVCWRLDRLGRTAKGLTALFEDLQARKVNLISLRDGVDLNTAAGRLMANVLASVGQFETEVRAERVMAGQRAARAKGKRWGGSKSGKVIATRATEEQIETISKLKRERKPISKIARAVGLSRQTVYKYL